MTGMKRPKEMTINKQQIMAEKARLRRLRRVAKGGTDMAATRHALEKKYNRERRRRMNPNLIGGWFGELPIFSRFMHKPKK